MLALDLRASLPTFVTQTPLKELLGRFFSKYVFEGELQQVKNIVIITANDLYIKNIASSNFDPNLKKSLIKNIYFNSIQN